MRFSQKVRQYLIHAPKRQGTGKKEDPAQVAKDMRTASTIEGERMFECSRVALEVPNSRFLFEIVCKHQTGKSEGNRVDEWR